MVFQATLNLHEKELSDLKHASWGDFLVYLDHRAPLSNADWEDHHGVIEKEFLEQEKNMIFAQWLTKARADSKLKMMNKQRKRK